ncbi:MAG: hypothetical protein KW793_04755 [Candidatus Doudnabacteria bacterium]|nr:hypothetical protein [Candidatus Doudnabacteria bacterium]
MNNELPKAFTDWLDSKYPRLTDDELKKLCHIKPAVKMNERSDEKRDIAIDAYQFAQSEKGKGPSDVNQDFSEPIAMKAGDTRVLINGMPIPVDFRVIWEDNYQHLCSTAVAAPTGVDWAEIDIHKDEIIGRHWEAATAQSRSGVNPYAYIAGFKDALKYLKSRPAFAQEKKSPWTLVDVQLPEAGVEVIGQSDKWIHPDYNPDGTRVCFVDDQDEWVSAKWDNEQDSWHTHAKWCCEDHGGTDFNPTQWQPKPQFNPHSPKQ